MRFEYNSIQIGEGATGTYSSNTKIDSKPSWSWSFSTVTWSCEFSKKTDTETTLRAFDAAMRNTLTGLCKISANLEITYADGSSDSFKEEPAGAQPTGVSHNPILEHIPGDYTTNTYQRYRFTVTFEMPTGFNGVKVMQVTATHDALGYQNIHMTGIMPSSYINGTHDAVKAFDQYFTSKIEKAVLSTFLGKDYYKRVEGPNITSEKGLGALGNLSEGRWKGLSFEVSYRQVAFAEQSESVVSEHLVAPMIVVSQIPETGVALKLPSNLSLAGGGSQAQGGGATASGENTTTRFTVMYEAGVSIDSSYLGAAEKIIKAKKKGYEAQFSGLSAVYHEVVFPHIIRMLKDMFGGSIALYNEQVTYTNEPRIRVTATAIPKASVTFAYQFDSYSYQIAKGVNYKILDGKPFSMVRIEPGDVAVASFTRTTLSTSKTAANVDFGSAWKVDSGGVANIREAGAVYESNKLGRITFQPLYEATMQYTLSYHGEGSRVNVIAGTAVSGSGGGGGESPGIGYTGVKSPK